MEKIKVNMSPNPLDVQTIHASQNDGEARQWEFELHNNGELIDTSDVKEQMVFKAYKGGTEQLLPENGSTPTTSPFKGDIRYPQGLLTDQEFTYRQSPTESDGLAKITDIKGNTIVWNQLIESVMATGTNSGITCTNNGDGSFTLNGTATANATFRVDQSTVVASDRLKSYSKGKYLCTTNIPDKIRIVLMQNSTWVQIASFTNILKAVTIENDFDNVFAFIWIENGTTLNNLRIYPQLFNISKMGLDALSVEEFTSLLPLPYYAYNQGSLLSFNGNGIKTVGKNILVDSGYVQGVLGWNNSPSDSNIAATNAFISSPFIPIPNGVTQITITSLKGDIVRYWETDSGYKGLYFSGNHPKQGETITRTLSQGCKYVRISIGIDGTRVTPNDYGTLVYGQIEFGNQATSYEPYTSSTLSLPISTYFPNGMNGFDGAYDELTSSKATNRIYILNIDSSTTISTWESSDGWTANITLNSYKPNGAIKSDKFEYIGSFNGAASFATSAKAKGGFCVGAWQNGNRVYFYSSSATTSNDLINAIRGTNLYYELATPTETSFTTASLVTENAEIPLSNDDGVLLGKCTEELSAEPGFHDAKIKLSDSDGECYSNKIQLHVERSPQ